MTWTLRSLILMMTACLLWQSGLAVRAEDPNPLVELAEETGVSHTLPHLRMLLNGEVFNLEVAIRQEDKLQGLMYRTKLKPKSGMLFRFYPARRVDFWMKNTKIPLDMLFIRSGQIVHVVHSATPCKKDPCPSYPSLLPVDSVVELAGGSAQKYNITEGDVIQLLPPKKPVAKKQPPNPSDNVSTSKTQNTGTHP